MSHCCLKDAFKLKSFFFLLSSPREMCTSDVHRHPHACFTAWSLHMDLMFTGWLLLFNIIIYQWAYFFIFPPLFLSEQLDVDGFKCLQHASGFSRVRLQISLPPIILVENQHHSPCLVAFFTHYRVLTFNISFQVKEPKLYIHGNTKIKDIMQINWAGCSWIFQRNHDSCFYGEHDMNPTCTFSCSCSAWSWVVDDCAYPALIRMLTVMFTPEILRKKWIFEESKKTPN